MRLPFSGFPSGGHFWRLNNRHSWLSPGWLPLGMLGLLAVGFSLKVGATVGAEDRRVPPWPPGNKALRVIIDTDAATEIDDQHALALALVSPDRFKIEGIVAAHFGDKGGPSAIERSYQEVLTVLEKAGRKGRIPVKKGSDPFTYSQVPPPSEGVDFIIERAMADDPDPLWLICLGPCTDIAAAWLKEPRIKDRVIAFWHGRTQWPTKAWNFNAYNDLKAVRVLFASNLPLVLFDTGTDLTCPMEESEQRIRPYGALGAYLHEIRFRSPAWQSPKKGIFDLGDIAALIDPSLVAFEVVKAPSVQWDMLYDHNATHGQMVRIFSIDRNRTFDLLEQRLAQAANGQPNSNSRP
ncbi:MAG: nucleoside hydrolase [Thermogutta sp.]